jgi:hypothetical protein
LKISGTAHVPTLQDSPLGQDSKILIRAKADLGDFRIMSFDDGRRFAEHEHLLSIETSAAEAGVICEAFRLLAGEKLFRGLRRGISLRWSKLRFRVSQHESTDGPIRGKRKFASIPGIPIDISMHSQREKLHAFQGKMITLMIFT